MKMVEILVWERLLFHHHINRKETRSVLQAVYAVTECLAYHPGSYPFQCLCGMGIRDDVLCLEFMPARCLYRRYFAIADSYNFV